MRINTTGSPPPLVAFVDERLEHPPGFTRIITGCCVFGRNRWMHFYQQAASVPAVGKKRRRLAVMKMFLESMRGISVLAFADIPSDLYYRKGENDGTADIPRMSRTDNLWAMAILSGITSAVAWRTPPGTIDLYFDRKDLRAAHRTQFENILRQTLPEIARQSAAEFPSVFGPSHHEFQFGTIEAIDKPALGSVFDAFQQGTHMAHLLCSLAPNIIAEGSSNLILVKNHTNVVRRMVAKFVPSFHDEPGRQMIRL